MRLGRSLGFEWIASLATIDRPDGLDPPLLATFLRDQYGLAPGFAPNPIGVRANKPVTKRPLPIPSELIERFAHEEAGRLAYVGTTIKSLARPVLAAAIGRAVPAERERERAAKLLNALEPPTKLTRVFDPNTETRLYTLAPRDLYSRALLEIVELLNDEPPLGICKHCKRLFVKQRTTDTFCRRFIWPTAGRTVIAGCIYDLNPTPLRADLDAHARRKESKRRQMRVARLTSTLGPNHPETTRERAAFEQWKKAHPVPRGRRPTPVPPEFLLDRGLRPMNA
jgi:hypothetical protein